MSAAGSFERKLSAEEAREGYILILKGWLKRFPPPGERFSLREGSEMRAATIEAVDCECRGPEKPHQHYHLRCAGLTPGDRVRITWDEQAGAFELATERGSFRHSRRD